MSPSTIIGIILAATAAFFVLIYNRMVAMRQSWKNAYADIDVQLKQRQDLVPNLVSTVKGYAAHESSVFENVTAARASAMKASTPAQRGAAEGALTGALVNLMAVAENYPELKANENFKQLQEELEDLENKIAASRRFFNNAVAAYNTSIAQFPATLIANSCGFTPANMFELDATEKAAASTPPKVSFGS